MNLKKLASQLRTPIAHKVWPRQHTNFDNEITGDYYRSNSFFEEQIDWGMIGWTVAMMGVCGVIYLVAF